LQFCFKLNFRDRSVNAGLHLVKPHFWFIFCGMDGECRAIAPAKGKMNEPAKTCLDWGTIPSPDTGVILQKIAEPDEFVGPQSFRGNHGLASR
jgi:hypothetical protein